MTIDEDRELCRQYVKLLKAKSRERRRAELKKRINQLTETELAEYVNLTRLAKCNGDENNVHTKQ